jgi:hypothetical protein
VTRPDPRLSALDDPDVIDWRARGRSYDQASEAAPEDSGTRQALHLAAVYCRRQALAVIFAINDIHPPRRPPVTSPFPQRQARSTVMVSVFLGPDDEPIWHGEMPDVPAPGDRMWITVAEGRVPRDRTCFRVARRDWACYSPDAYAVELYVERVR